MVSHYRRYAARLAGRFGGVKLCTIAIERMSLYSQHESLIHLVVNYNELPIENSSEVNYKNGSVFGAARSRIWQEML